jgi:hypothetical protein
MEQWNNISYNDARLKINTPTHTSSIPRKESHRPRQLFPIINKSSTTNINSALLVH